MAVAWTSEMNGSGLKWKRARALIIYLVEGTNEFLDRCQDEVNNCGQLFLDASIDGFIMGFIIADGLARFTNGPALRGRAAVRAQQQPRLFTSLDDQPTNNQPV